MNKVKSSLLSGTKICKTEGMLQYILLNPNVKQIMDKKKIEKMELITKISPLTTIHVLMKSSYPCLVKINYYFDAQYCISKTS